MGRPEDGAIAADFTAAAEQTMDEATQVEPWPVAHALDLGLEKAAADAPPPTRCALGLESTPLTSSTAVVNRAGVYRRLHPLKV